MNTLSDSFCVISIVGAVAAAAVRFVDGDGTDGVVGGAVDDDDTDGHAVVTYHRTSSFRICIVFISIDAFFDGFWFTPSQFINTLLFDFQLN